jgi:hypothetical protein
MTSLARTSHWQRCVAVADKPITAWIMIGRGYPSSRRKCVQEVPENRIAHWDALASALFPWRSSPIQYGVQNNVRERDTNLLLSTSSIMNSWLTSADCDAPYIDGANDLVFECENSITKLNIFKCKIKKFRE